MPDLIPYSASRGPTRQARKAIVAVREDAIIAQERLSAAGWVAYSAQNHVRGLAAQETHLLQQYPHAAHRAFLINDTFAQTAAEQVYWVGRPRCSGH